MKGALLVWLVFLSLSFHGEHFRCEAPLPQKESIMSGNPSRASYDPRKLRRSMSRPPPDSEHNQHESRGREVRRQYDSYRPRTSRSRSPVRSGSDRQKGYQGHRGGDPSQSKDLPSLSSEHSRDRNPSKRAGPPGKHKTTEGQIEKSYDDIVPTKGKHLDLSHTKSAPPDTSVHARLDLLKQQFPEHYFEDLTFVPALEPLSSQWADKAKASIDAVERQYSEMYRYSRALSKIIRDLIKDIDQMKKVAILDENTSKKLEQDLEDTQAQLVIAQRDSNSFKKQFEELQKRYHDNLESHSQERLELKKQAEEAKSKSVEAEAARSALEREKAELARKNAELEKRNAELEAKLMATENRAALAEGNLDTAIKSNEEAHKQLSEANQELQGFGELTIEFFAHVIRHRNISWIEDYPTTLVHVWDQIIEWEKDELRVDSVDEDKLMEKYLRDDESTELAKGRQLIAAAMEEEKRQVKGKNAIETGSSSAAPEATGVEGYDPENPGIPKASLLSPIPESASEAAATPIEKSSEGTEVVAKATEQQESIAGERPIDEIQGRQDEVTPAEPEKKAGDKEESTDKVMPVLPVTKAPQDEDMIPALKGDSDDGGHEEEDDVSIVGESGHGDNMTLAQLKAQQDKDLQIKIENIDIPNPKPLAVVDAGSSVRTPPGKKPSDSSSSKSGRKKHKRLPSDAGEGSKESSKTAKKSKTTP